MQRICHFFVVDDDDVSVYKKRGAFLYPFTCAGVVGASPAVTPSKKGEMSQGKTEAQDDQSNAKAKTTKSRGTKQVPPARPLSGQPQQPRQDPCRGSSPTPAEHVTLEPAGSNSTNHIGTRAREAPLWWHADLCQDRRYMRSDEDRKTATLGGILAKESHETPGKILAGDDSAP